MIWKLDIFSERGWSMKSETCIIRIDVADGCWSKFEGKFSVAPGQVVSWGGAPLSLSLSCIFSIHFVHFQYSLIFRNNSNFHFLTIVVTFMHAFHDSLCPYMHYRSTFLYFSPLSLSQLWISNAWWWWMWNMVGTGYILFVQRSHSRFKVSLT